jgi:hypothetical protein
MRFLFLRSPKFGFEARLHADAKCGAEANRLCVAAHFGCALARLIDGQELVSLSLYTEGRWVVWDGYAEEGFFGGYGGRIRGEDAVLVATEVST